MATTEKRYYALTQQQEQIVSVEKVFPGTSVNTIVNAAVAEKSLTAEQIADGLSEVVKGIDTLHIRFTEQNGEIVQYFEQEESSAFERECFLADEAGYAAFLSLQAGSCLFGLDKPLYRFAIVTRPDGRLGVVASFHHAIADAWSCAAVLMEAVSNALRGKAQTAASFERLLASEQQEEKPGTIKKRMRNRDYWAQKYEDYSGNNTYAIRPGMDLRCSRLRFEIPSALYDGLQSFCKRLDYSMPMVFLGMVSLVKAYRDGEKFATVGFAALGRRGREEKKCFGYFIQMLPLMLRIDKGQCVSDYLRQIKQEEFGFLMHAAYPLAALLEDIRSSGAEVGNPMDISFSYQNVQYNTEIAEFFGEAQWIAPRHQTIPLSVHVSDRENEGILKVDYDYILSLYTKEDVEWFHNELIWLLEQLSTCICPEKMTLEQLSMVREAEKAQIMERFQGTKGNVPEENVATLLEESCARYPDFCALKTDVACYTYRELQNVTERIAFHLLRRGVQHGSRVAVLAKRCPEAVLCICAIIRTGAVYVPVDPAYPTQRVQQILEDVKPTLFLTETEDEKTPEIPGCTFRELLVQDEPVAMERLRKNQAAITPESEAYIIFTSGTTGKPKGVIVRHKDIVALVRDADYVPLNASVRILQTGSLAFDAATFEIWGALLNGGMTFLADKNVMLRADDLKACLIRQNINTMFITTALFNEMVESDVSVFDPLSDLLFGGEKTSEKCVDLLMQHPGHPKVTNVYGPTEATTFATFYSVPEKREYSQTPIGHPIRNMKAYVMQGNVLCGIGVPGELCIGGIGVAKGYLNRAEITAQKFIDNPFGEGKLYRTGDLVKWNAQGEMIFLGRIDAQVKIRGFRIETGEIETTLCKIPGITRAVVIVSENESGEKQLFACYTGETCESGSEVRQKLKTMLPAYMLPNELVKVENLPVNINGKLERKKLLQYFDMCRSTATERLEKPENETETMLCHAFAELLELAEVGRNQDFFDLGGHSLKVVRLLNLIEQNTGHRLKIEDVFANPTPERLAVCIAEKEEEAYVPIPSPPPQDSYPMSAAQRRIFFLNQLDRDSLAYNMPGYLELDECYPERLRLALQGVIDRHEILRTAFVLKDGMPVQKILDSVSVELPCMELPQSQWHMAMKTLIKPFDPETPPLLRMTVLRDQSKCRVLFDMSHLIGDGMSILNFVREFFALYRGTELPPLRCQYRDYSEWMRSRDFASEKAFWMEQFADEIPILEMPTDFKRTGQAANVGKRISASVSPELRTSLLNMARENGATEYMMYLSALMITLQMYSGQDDIVIGTPVSGRTHRDTEQMLGMFVNTLALRGKPSGDKTYFAFLRELRDITLSALQNQEYPLDTLIEELKIRRSPGRNPLFDVVLAFQNNNTPTQETGVGEIHDISAFTETAKFDLTLNIVQEAEGYGLELEYSVNLYREETARRILKRFVHVLEQIANDTPERISDFLLATETEKQTILGSFNDTDKPCCLNDSVTVLLERQIASNGSRIAIEQPNGSMTYAELGEKMHRIAAGLTRRNVKPGDRVAVLAEKEMDVVAAVCGVLLCGAAYVFIDPTYPQSRIAYIIEDCSPICLLSCKGNFDTGTSVSQYQICDMETDTGDVPNCTVLPENVAYVIYTSGTMGRPKGSMIPHRGIVRLVNNPNYVTLDAQTVILQTGSLSFDASTFEIWGALLNGGRVVLVGQDILLDPCLLKQEILCKNVNTMWMTSTLFNQMIQLEPDIFDSLRDLLIGGEALSETHVAMMKARHNGVRLINGYGPTENTTFTTTYLIPERFDSLPIGKPIGNTKVYVVRDGKLCGIHMPGELWVSGAGVSAGYLNLPELTAEKFAPNPFGAGMVYKTGDLARWQSDGNLCFMGRLDEQIKFHGFRIELGEIEEKINQHPDVAETAVMIREDPSGEKYLTAYVVLHDGMLDNVMPDIKAYLQRDLPEYMLPAAWMTLKRLPVTSNGKVNKQALPFVARTAAGENYLAPESPEEKALCDAMAETLGLERVGVNDAFFEIGGDSIKSMRVIACLKKRGYELSVRDLLQYQSAGKICCSGAVGVLTQRYPQEVVAGTFDLSPIQKLFVNERMKKPEHFNQAVMLEINGNIEETALAEAMRRLLAHHDILRARFDGESQVIPPVEESAPIAMHRADFPCSYAEAANAAEALCGEWQSELSLAEGRNLGYGLIYCADRVLLLVYAHHMVIDGVSWRIVLEQLNELYQRLLSGQDAALPPKTIAYGHWVDVIKKYTFSEEVQTQRDYWSAICAETADNAASYGARNGVDTGAGRVTTVLDRTQFDSLYQHYRELISVGENEMLLAIFALALHQWKNIHCLCVDMERHGRDFGKEDLSASVGWFTVRYPFTCPIEPDLYAMLCSVKQASLDVPGRGESFGLLKYYGECDFSDVSCPACFNYLGDTQMPTADNALFRYTSYSTGKMSADENELFNPLSFDIIRTTDGMVCNLSYLKRCYAQEEIQSLSDCVQQAFHAALENMGSGEERVTFAKEVADVDLLGKMDEQDWDVLNDLF